MNMKKCDRCGRVIETSAAASVTRSGGGTETATFDLCITCVTKVDKILGLIDVAPEIVP